MISALLASRPVRWMCVAVFCLMAVAATPYAVDNLVSGYRMSGAEVCGGDARQGCLERSVHTARLTIAERGDRGEVWLLESPIGATTTVYVPEADRVQPGRVVALSWEGDIVLLETGPDDERVRTSLWGMRSAAGPLGFALAALGGALIAAPVRRRQVRTVGVGCAATGFTLGFLGTLAGWWAGVVVAPLIGIAAAAAAGYLTTRRGAGSDSAVGVAE